LDTPTTDTMRLRYLSADRVDGPQSTFIDFDVLNFADEKIGRLAGIIIDPRARRACYLVVEVGWFSLRRYLLPIGPTRVDEETRALLVDIDRAELKRCAEFEEGSFDPYSVDTVPSPVLN